LNEHINEPFKVYAFLNSIPDLHRSKYFYSSAENIREHSIKLNLLADMAMLHSTDDDDWLIFIDGDAFPIGDIVSFGREKLKEYPLIAIQRLENAGDYQPHPCFCLTTVKFWKEIQGDWNEGYQWKNPAGELVTDVGGNLLGILERKNVSWLPMLRSNKTNLHGLWFGIYHDLIYHHGAGFRNPFSRFDESGIRQIPEFINNLIFRITRKNINKKFQHNIISRNKELDEKVFQSIQADTHFYRFFQEPEKRII
jgi:hypothetical protein